MWHGFFNSLDYIVILYPKINNTITNNNLLLDVGHFADMPT